MVIVVIEETVSNDFDDRLLNYFFGNSFQTKNWDVMTTTIFAYRAHWVLTNVY